MPARRELTLLIDDRGDAVALLSPGVGLFTAARSEGDLLAAGERAGVLLVLGETISLVVPAGVEGRITSAPPARTRQPVGWGDPLYELRPIAAETTADHGAARSRGRRDAAARDPAGPEADGRLVVRSPQSGRFYLRPTPGDAPFVSDGAIVEAGQPIGLIEVMKTFAHVPFAGPGLPARARVVRVLVDDGAEVAAGDALLEIAPIEAPRAS
jgi:acetyl-CoA carboxylase biotin carboxyl carrier protein